MVEINSRSAGSLNYEDHERTGLTLIAVGGYSLSRGLTLQGLMVSYFLRNSMMYDTLMQMGRWFGYHPGYEDLCRVWLPEEAEGWYAHVAELIEELREELRIMEAANATPVQFGLKVRGHPDALMVTARNKMGSGELVRVAIGLGNHFVETAVLRRDAFEENRQSVRRLAEDLARCGRLLSSASEAPTGWLLHGCSGGTDPRVHRGLPQPRRLHAHGSRAAAPLHRAAPDGGVRSVGTSSLPSVGRPLATGLTGGGPARRAGSLSAAEPGNED